MNNQIYQVSNNYKKEKKMKKNTMTNKEIMKEASKQGRKDGKNQVPRQEWGAGSVPYLTQLQHHFAGLSQQLDVSLEQKKMQKEMAKVDAIRLEIQEKGKSEALLKNLARAEEELKKIQAQLDGAIEEVPMAKFARMRMIGNMFYAPFLFFLFIGEVMITAPAFQILLAEKKATAWIITYAVSFLTVGAAHILGIFLKSQFDRSRPKSKLYNVIFIVIAGFVTSTIVLMSYIRGSNSALSAGMLTEIDPSWRLEFLWIFYSFLQLTFVVVGIAISFMHYSEIESTLSRTKRKVWILRKLRDNREAKKIKSGNSVEETGVDESNVYLQELEVIETKKKLLESNYLEAVAAYRSSNINSRSDEMDGAHPSLQALHLDLQNTTSANVHSLSVTR
jgi:hypothetical protein